MQHKQLNAIVAAGVFCASILVYALTIAPTVVFWDVGEFIAAAKMLQVPHPPGSPLFLLLARVAMLIPFAADQAVRAHALSAVLSAAAILFFYLVIVRVLREIRGTPVTLVDRITVYGSACIGALSLAYGSTYWDNSIEAEVYGASMLFLAAVLWLAMKWRDHGGDSGNEKYILLIAYLLGLSLGVHLLALLAIVPVAMLIYFKRYAFTTKSFIVMALATVVIFFIVYPGIVKYLPSMMDGEFRGRKSDIIAVIPWVVIGGVLLGAYWSYRNKRKILHIGLLSISLILLGYTTYIGVLMRSNVNPPMNENSPDNLARLVSYLGREQYGDAPVWPRRYSQEPHQQGIYTNYSSEWDFLFRYQLNHMFFRYVGWNYIGAEGDWQDAGVSAKELFGVPFLLGLFGVYWLFRKDWKLGLVSLAMFVVFGPILALYQNQQEPQPRERDYFYVGAYYVYSLWMAIGLVGIIDLLRMLVKSEKAQVTAAGAVVIGFMVLVPGRMLQIGWPSHDRSGNYVAWDYSYNILQSCEKDAILFTNGDNDTFPLWYLQDVEGVRRDVRIVNLSLVNTPWYIKQMRDKSHYPEALPVPISFTDQQIETIQPIRWVDRTIDLPIPPEAIQRYGVTDTAILNARKIPWHVRPTMSYGEITAIRTQDIMILDIIRTNAWKRPVYFAVTCAPDSKVGLDEYLWFHGLAWRLEPRRIRTNEMGIDPGILSQNLMDEPEGFATTPRYGYKFRGIANPKVVYDENTSRLMLNYRSAFVRMAMYYNNIAMDTAKAAATLERMEKLIPSTKIPYGWELGADLAWFFYRLGRMDRFNTIADQVEAECRNLIAAGNTNLQSPYNPYRVLLDMYDLRHNYTQTLVVLKDLTRFFPNDPNLKSRIATTERLLQSQQKGDTAAAPATTP